MASLLCAGRCGTRFNAVGSETGCAMLAPPNFAREIGRSGSDNQIEYIYAVAYTFTEYVAMHLHSACFRITHFFPFIYAVVFIDLATRDYRRKVEL